jgi:hypothetical protein
LKHDLDGQSSFVVYQQDTKFGLLDMHFSENKLDAKFVATDGSTMDHFSIAKTAKKAVIERISDDTFSDTNIKQVSDKKTTKAEPLADQAEVQEDKPAITFKLDEGATTDTKAKPLADQAEVQEDKPAITFKLDEGATTDTKAKPLADQAEVQEDKPAITFKGDEDATTFEDATTDTIAKPLADQAEVQEDKPAITTKLDGNPPTDDSNQVLMSEEQLEQEQDKPAITTKLDANPPTDDIPMSLAEEKVDSSDNEKSVSFQSSENVDESYVQNLLEPSENNSPIDDEVSDSDEEKTTKTNLRDPFAALN